MSKNVIYQGIKVKSVGTQVLTVHANASREASRRLTKTIGGPNFDAHEDLFADTILFGAAMSIASAAVARGNLISGLTEFDMDVQVRRGQRFGLDQVRFTSSLLPGTPIAMFAEDLKSPQTISDLLRRMLYGFLRAERQHIQETLPSSPPKRPTPRYHQHINLEKVFEIVTKNIPEKYAPTPAEVEVLAELRKVFPGSSRFNPPAQKDLGANPRIIKLIDGVLSSSTTVPGFESETKTKGASHDADVVRKVGEVAFLPPATGKEDKESPIVCG